MLLSAQKIIWLQLYAMKIQILQIANKALLEKGIVTLVRQSMTSFINLL